MDIDKERGNERETDLSKNIAVLLICRCFSDYNHILPHVEFFNTNVAMYNQLKKYRCDILSRLINIHF